MMYSWVQLPQPNLMLGVAERVCSVRSVLGQPPWRGLPPRLMQAKFGAPSIMHLACI